MSVMNRMRISAKVGVIIATFVLLCGAVAAFSGANQIYVSRQLLASFGRYDQSMLTFGYTSDSLSYAEVALAEAGALQDVRGVADLDRTQADFDRKFAAFGDHVRPKFDSEMDQLEASHRVYRKAVASYRALLVARDYEGARNALAAQVRPAFSAIKNQLADMAGKIGASSSSTSVNILKRAAQTQWVFLVLAALALIVTAVSSVILLQRGISAPLKAVTRALDRLTAGDTTAILDSRERGDEIGDLTRAYGAFRQSLADKRAAEASATEHREAAEAERRRHEALQQAVAAEQTTMVSALADALSHLAGGDLSYRIEAAFPAAYETLRTDFNAAMDQLEGAMGTIARAAHGIRAGADELSRAADDLSGRTEQQAATLEETAAAVDQITSASRVAAASAEEVRAAVDAARAGADRSRSVLDGTVAAIHRVQQSAQQVNQIVGVIDEIAFQTNLLALNAGVEAARAGEFGRGFAVVATEVRALAQRSAVAAKEIKSLIAASTGEVDASVELVGQTGRALEQIVDKVAEVNGLVAGIAAAAREQSTSLQEVNAAVEQMDRNTQSNVAAVEESAAVSQGFAVEAQELMELIGRFRIRRVEAPPTPARPPAPVLRRAS